MGGAEQSVLQLIPRLAALGYKQSILTLLPISRARHAEFTQHCEHVISLSSKPKFRIWDLVRLPKMLCDIEPDIIQAWMYHANFLASALSAFGFLRKRNPLIVWNVRMTLHRITDLKWTTQIVLLCNRFLSSRPNTIVYNSEEAKQTHEQFGFSGKNSTVIVNGINLEVFRTPENPPSRTIKDLPTTAICLGMLARFDALKDFRNLLLAFSLLQDKIPDLYLIVAGPGVSFENPDFATLVATCNADRRRIRALGEIAEPQKFYLELDLFCLSSRTESFPNVVAEAMSCGLPVIATDVGGVGELVGNCGIVVPARDSEALAEQIEILTRDPELRAQIGEQASKRIATLFSLEKAAARYVELYGKLLPSAF